jgi:hypothetical protein
VPKIVMTEREYKNLETGEESWAPLWETNMDSLREAVEFTETLGHYVTAAFVDWGGAPAIVMARRDTMCMFLGNDSDHEWFELFIGEPVAWTGDEEAGL